MIAKILNISTSNFVKNINYVYVLEKIIYKIWTGKSSLPDG